MDDVEMEIEQAGEGSDVRRLFQEWHQAVRDRDVDRLAELYAPQATFESPAVLVLDDEFHGVLTGREEIASFFNSFFDRLDEAGAEWFRTGDLSVNGRLLAWEQSDEGGADAVRMVQSMEIADGVIAHHRVYWNWAGFRNLMAHRPRLHEDDPSAPRYQPLVLVKSS